MKPVNVVSDRAFFQEHYPQIMKKTKLLILNHDVVRYHSFDLLRYQLFRDTQTRQFQHFSSILPEYRLFLHAKADIAEQVKFMQKQVKYFNVYECFSDSMGIDNVVAYTEKIQEMFQAPYGNYTRTDIASTFQIVFDRNDIEGYLLQYTNETCRPNWHNLVTVYEDPFLLNLDAATDIIVENNINAVMLCSSELALRLAYRLIERGYHNPMTILIGRYGYNFLFDNAGNWTLPIFNAQLGLLEINYHYEIGYFDPYTGLTRQNKYAEFVP